MRAAMDYIKNGAFKDDYNNLKTIIDWKAIKAHGIDTGTIPSNAVILNKPESIFVSHFREVMTAFVVVIWIFLITALLWVWSISRANNKLKAANLECDTARSTAEKLAMRDTLTGLLNRRAVMPLITHEMNQKKRYGNPVSLLVLDIDHFKHFNDTHGHDYGDIVLEMIAKSLSSSCRKTDAISRWGGRNF